MKKVFLINIYEDIPTDTRTFSFCYLAVVQKIFPKENLKQESDTEDFSGKPKKLTTTTGSFAFYEIFVFFFFAFLLLPTRKLQKGSSSFLLLRPGAMKNFGVDKSQTKVG